MDPNATLARIKRLRADVRKGTAGEYDRADLQDAIDDLQRWIDRGGFKPRGYTRAAHYGRALTRGPKRNPSKPKRRAAAKRVSDETAGEIRALRDTARMFARMDPKGAAALLKRAAMLESGGRAPRGNPVKGRRPARMSARKHAAHPTRGGAAYWSPTLRAGTARMLARRLDALHEKPGKLTASERREMADATLALRRLKLQARARGNPAPKHRSPAFLRLQSAMKSGHATRAQKTEFFAMLKRGAKR